MADRLRVSRLRIRVDGARPARSVLAESIRAALPRELDAVTARAIAADATTAIGKALRGARE